MNYFCCYRFFFWTFAYLNRSIMLTPTSRCTYQCVIHIQIDRFDTQISYRYVFAMCVVVNTQCLLVTQVVVYICVLIVVYMCVMYVCSIICACISHAGSSIYIYILWAMDEICQQHTQQYMQSMYCCSSIVQYMLVARVLVYVQYVLVVTLIGHAHVTRLQYIYIYSMYQQYVYIHSMCMV